MIKRSLTLILCLCLVVGMLGGFGTVNAKNSSVEYSAMELIKKTTDTDTYDYFLINNAFAAGKETIVLSTENAISSDKGLSFNINSDADARYFVKVAYRVTTERLSDISCSLLVNEKLQYKELDGFVLPKEYLDGGEVKKDIYGNEITPDQVVSTEPCENYIFDYTGVYSQPLSVNLTAGENLLTFNYPNEDAVILKIILIPALSSKGYKEYIAQHSDDKIYKGENISYEGENADLKSDAVLYPTSDKSSAVVSPVETGKILLNAIGGNNWKKANQYITWNVKVPESGLYTITLKTKQNLNVAQQSRRAIYINGEIPFAEAGNIIFDYSSKWQMKTLGDDKENYLFYLEKGENEIKLDLVSAKR